MKPMFVMLVGLPASGKSTYAKKLKDYLSKDYNGIDIYSSDKLRLELFGDENSQQNNDLVFNELHKRIKNALKHKKSVIYDATNIHYKYRMNFLKEIHKIQCYKVCTIIATPYKTCLERNENRSRKVPESVIERMYKNFNIPYYFEGWDDIIIEKSTKPKHVFDFIDYDAKGFNQENKYHQFDLSTHCYLTGHNLIGHKHWIHLQTAGYLHDIGKLYTKSHLNSKGEYTEDAHYYNHANVSAYESMFYYNVSLYSMFLINWHMRPFVWENNEKLKLKERKMLGDDIFNDIMDLHKSDLENS